MPFITDMYHEQNRARSKRAEQDGTPDEGSAGSDSAGPSLDGTPEDTSAGPSQDGSARTGSAAAFDPEALADRLRSRIVGQDAAVDAVVRAVTLGEAGVTDAQRPLANVLLVGPTGVGKTELVRQVASMVRSSPDDLCRVDMSALAQEHYAASFSGAPPGYAGSKEAYSVFDRSTIEGDPYTPGIVLFDEVEKAHSTVLRALLHVLDNGTLKLANGQQTISFRNSFVFMTSNLGSTDLARRRRSGVRRLAGRLRGRAGTTADRLAARGNDGVLTAALRDFFDAEFLNRIDETVVFSELDRESAAKITELEVEQLRRRLKRRSVGLEVDPAVLDLLCERGFDAVYGARALRRTVRTELATPVAEAVLRASRAPTEHDGAAPVIRAQVRDGAVYADVV